MRPYTLSARCPCGEIFAATIAGAGRPSKFCSDHCRKKARHNRTRRLISKQCEVCGDPFKTANSRTACCGRCCSQILLNRRRNATRRKNARARSARFCETCASPFHMRNPSGKARAGKSHEGRFCSRSCAAQFMRHPAQLNLFAASASTR